MKHNLIHTIRREKVLLFSCSMLIINYLVLIHNKLVHTHKKEKTQTLLL